MKPHAWIFPLLAVGWLACSPEPPPKTPDALGPGQVTPPAKAPPAQQGSIQIDPKLAKLCNIPTSYFAFDSARLSAEAQSALDALATCFETGPAMGRNMTIVGHADPRGELDYNFALGQRRAGSVENHLKRRGMQSHRIESSSRGELDAKGHDEETWARDRKVLIALTE
jgi:peptidoglycan-associated lipoprotein